MRVLILPYKASPKDLYSERYVYFIVDEPQWVVGASKYGEESNDMILEKPGVPTKQKKKNEPRAPEKEQHSLLKGDF